MIDVELVTERNENEYKNFIDGCSCALAQHTLEWRDVIVGIGADTPVYLLARYGDEVVGVLPSFLYQCELGNLINSVPHAGGYGGVVTEEHSPHKEAIYEALLTRLVLEAKRNKCLLVTISTPPFFGERELYRRHFQPDFERENFYQFLDLGIDFLASIDTKKRGNIKRNVRKARELGLRVVIEDTDDRFEQWYAIHQKRMAELGAHPLPRLLFEGARRHMSKAGRGFLAYVLDGEKVVGGALFLGLHQVQDIFMISTDSDYFEKEPNGLLVWETLDRAKLRGYRYYNWQSSSSRQSGVYEYKRGWGSREGLHYYITKITGDISRLQRSPIEVIKQRYRWHYVMPFEHFEPQPCKHQTLLASESIGRK